LLPYWPLYVDIITSFGILSSTCWTFEKWPQDPAPVALRGRQRWLPMAGVFRKALGPLREDVPCCDQWEHPFFWGSLSTENSNMIMIYYDYCSNSKHVFRLNSCGMKNVWTLGWMQLGEHRERDSEHVWVLLDLIWTSYKDVDGWRNELIFEQIMYFDTRLSFCGISGSPGVPRRSPLTIGCPRNWMNMWSCDCTMLSPRVSCWRTGLRLAVQTGRTRVLLYRLGSKRDWWWLVMKNKLVSFFLGGPTSTWSLAGFCEKASQIHPNYRVKLKCRHFSWSCLKWTTNPIHCFNRLWRQATCATCATCTYHSCKVWCTWITTLRWKCRQGQGQTRPFNHNLETRCPETRCPGRAKCLAEDIEQFLVKVVPKSWHLLVLTPKLVIDLKRLEHLGLVSYVPEEQRLVIQKCLGWGWEAPPHDRNIDLQDARISWPYHIPHTT
jgi:hypothetical protein